MRKAILLRTCGEVSLVDVPDDMPFSWPSTQIGCDWIEIVHAKLLDNPFCIVCDEEGAMKCNFVNFIASYLYGTHVHGQPIVGDVLIMQEELTEEGYDLRGIPKEAAVTLSGKLTELRQDAHDLVTAKLWR